MINTLAELMPQIHVDRSQVLDVSVAEMVEAQSGVVRSAGVPSLVPARQCHVQMERVLADVGDDDGITLRKRCGKPAAIPSHTIMEASDGPAPLVTATMAVHRRFVAHTVSGQRPAPRVEGRRSPLPSRLLGLRGGGWAVAETARRFTR